MAKREPSRSKVLPHAFERDDEIGPVTDWRGRTSETCAACHLIGKAGDPRHPHGALPMPRPTPHPPAPAGAAEIDARRLGERGAA